MKFPDDTQFLGKGGTGELCAVCSSMTLGKLRSADGFDHHQEAYRLRLESKKEDGCPICTIIWKSIYEPVEEAAITQRSSEHLNLGALSGLCLAGETPDLAHQQRTPRTISKLELLHEPVKLFLNTHRHSSKSEVDLDDPIRDFQVICAPRGDSDRVHWMGSKRGYGLSEARFWLFAPRFKDRGKRNVIKGYLGITVEHCK